jgi:hypothetical protein
VSAISDVLEPLTLDAIFNQTALGTFATHVALFTTATTDAGGGTEVSGFAYARVLVNPNSGISPKWNLAVVDGTAFLVDNLDVITFPTASGGNWGTISHVALYDAITVGNSLWHGPLDTPIVVNDGTTFSFPAGNLNMTLD